MTLIIQYSNSQNILRWELSFWAITQYSLCNSPEERSSHLLRGGILKSRSSQLSDFKFGFLCYDTADNRPLGQSDRGNCCFLSFIWILDLETAKSSDAYGSRTKFMQDVQTKKVSVEKEKTNKVSF